MCSILWTHRGTQEDSAGSGTCISHPLMLLGSGFADSCQQVCVCRDPPGQKQPWLSLQLLGAAGAGHGVVSCFTSKHLSALSQAQHCQGTRRASCRAPDFPPMPQGRGSLARHQHPSPCCNWRGAALHFLPLCWLSPLWGRPFASQQQFWLQHALLCPRCEPGRSSGRAVVAAAPLLPAPGGY